MVNKKGMKLCPLLVSKGVFENDPGYGQDKNYIKSICLNCPLKSCIYDYPGPIREADRKLLEEIANEL